MYLSCTSRASQVTAISYIQLQSAKYLCASIILTGFVMGWISMGWITRWGSLWMVFPSVCAPHFVSPSVGVYSPSKKNQRIHTLFVLLLEYHWICEFVLGIPGNQNRKITVLSIQQSAFSGNVVSKYLLIVKQKAIFIILIDDGGFMT